MICCEITLRFGNKLPLQYCENRTETFYSPFKVNNYFKIREKQK